MKKYFKSPKYKRRNAARAKISEKKKKIFKDYRRKRNRWKLGKKKYKYKRQRNLGNRFQDFNYLKAPYDFRFKDDPEKTIEFLIKLKKLYLKKKKVFVQLDHITNIDYDAILVLLSIMVKFKSKRIDFNGNFPKNPVLKEFLMQSGFFRNLSRTYLDLERYKIEGNSGHSFHTHAYKKVDSVLATQLIEAATEHVWKEKRRYLGCYRALVELMLNTNNHASPLQIGEKHWWLSVQTDEKNKKVCFSFVDYGVGIFNSLMTKPRGNKFFGAIGTMFARYNYKNDAELLKLILSGELHKTVTKQHFRGKGLPGIFNAFQRNQISNLHIVSNNVFADVTNNRYEMLNNSFEGTFVYWEITDSNSFLKD